MELAELILEYVKALVWPITAIALGLVCKYPPAEPEALRCEPLKAA
jgi:hypothetical protein